MLSIESVTLFLPAILAVLTCLLTFIFIRRNATKQLNDLPGPKPIPFFGNALDLFVPSEQRLPVIRSWHKEFSSYPFMRLWIGNRPNIFVTRASAAEVILRSSKHIEKSYEYSFLHPWLGTGLLTSTGSKWHSRRKLLTPAFHFKILDDFLQVFNEQSKIFQSKLLKVNGRSPDGFNIFPYITRCALDAICDAAMGRHVNAQEEANSEYVKAVYEIGAIVQNRQLYPWLQPNIIFKWLPIGFRHRQCLNVLHGFTEKVIAEKKTEFKARYENGIDKPVEKKRLAFLDLLIEASGNGKYLSDFDIREEVDTFMFEGHDTTAAGIGWCLFFIGRHPEIQERVHEELDLIFGDDPERDFTMADLTDLKYLECCIKEAQRLSPSVPIFSRHATEDIEMDGFIVPKGSAVSIVPFLMHRDPTYFKDPERFDPDRFLPENSMGRHPYAYIPFSAGPRNCIGQKFAMMEEKVVVGSILRKFKITSLEKFENVPVLIELVTRPKCGFKVKLSPRNI
ncbi:cytochrome P450 4c3-like [Artemia franciscana]|uniref:cytochrome P450 4c3-like n=1 Tax=Artemia franciscana TaxID=6661 RepID=UPI0032DAFB16